MRMNYKTYPTDYVQQLKTAKNRRKARSFMEYWDDMEHGDVNSYGFYAISWKCSKDTSYKWIQEFNHEIELFFSHWDLKNKIHYKSVQNKTERQPNETNGQQTQDIGIIEDSTERQPNKALNLYNNNNIKEKTFWNDKEFGDLFFIYGANTKYKGKKDEAYEVFKYIDVNVDLLKLAAMKYLHDPATEGKRYNLTNFLKNQIYLSYLPKRMKLTLDGIKRDGTYDNNTMIFTSSDGSFAGQLSAKRLIELYESKELEFINA